MQAMSFIYCLSTLVVMPQYNLEYENNFWSLVLASCTGRVQSVFSDTKSSLLVALSLAVKIKITSRVEIQVTCFENEGKKFYKNTLYIFMQRFYKYMLRLVKLSDERNKLLSATSQTGYLE